MHFINIRAAPCENVSSAYTDSEGRDQPVHLHILIRAFIVWHDRIIGYYKMYEWREKARMILCTSTGWSESCILRIFFTHFISNPLKKMLLVQNTKICFTVLRQLSWVPITHTSRGHPDKWAAASESVPDMCTQRRFWSDCANAQSNQNLSWVHFR